MNSQHADKARQFLMSAANPDGGWPYTHGKPSTPEASCYAAMALCTGRQADGVSERALAWLRTRARSAITSPSSCPQWTTALVLLALHRVDPSGNMNAALVKRVLSFNGQQTEANPLVKMDTKLRGWSWVDGTFSWVEPTSYALLALKAAGIRKHDRILEAERLLCDRVCSDGGWNYGNPQVRNIDLPSMAPTTALAAMALQGFPSAGSIVNRALAFLEREAPAHPSTLALSWSISCTSIYGRSADELTALLVNRQRPDGSWRGEVHLTALALLAIRAAQEKGANVFEI